MFFKYAKIVFIILAAICIQYFWGFAQIVEAFEEFAQNNSSAYVFLPVMGMGCAVGVPLSFCYVFAASAYALPKAFLLCIMGLFTSSLIGFFIGNVFSELPYVRGLKNKFLPQHAENTIYFKLNFFIRAIPGVPYFAQNLILASLSKKSQIFTYLLINICVQGLIALAMILIFNAAFREKFLIAITLVIALIATYIVLRKKCLKM
ncbi:MAG: hypothetical protein SPI34_03550 [Opitutales bacterium]|nr:hypothetical protein [Opitutales bacterium]